MSRIVTAVLTAIVFLPASVRAQNVTVQEDDSSYTLANGIVTAKISKQTGNLSSLIYKDTEVLAMDSGTPGAYWSHNARSSNQVRKITIDPATNGGAIGEVSVKGIASSEAMGGGPGGAFRSDVEIRYTMERGGSGLYTYATFEHKPEYPDATLGEARYCAKLASTFDWMLVDKNHNHLYTREMDQGDNKYNYTTVQFENRAYGFASNTKNMGFFFLNTSVEYLTGPPTKVEFLCHRDTTAVAAPCVLNYWRSSHYGGASVDVAAGEHWTKVVGPFMIYVNSGMEPQAAWKDAKEQLAREEKKWPYEFVSGVDYPREKERGTVKGQLTLNDPLMPGGAKMSKVMVGVTHPDYRITVNRPYALNSPVDIDWRNDAKHYSFWAQGEDNGTFSIPDVRPGKYTLHAFATGVLGEYAKTEITVEAGKTLDLGKLDWKPVRRGKQLWEVGIPNRNGSEYVKGDDYFHNRMDRVYAEMFPNDINYVIGKSDFKKDWFYLHVPHAQPAAPATAPAAGLAAAPPTTAPGAVSGVVPGRGRGFGRGRGGPATGPGVAAGPASQPTTQVARGVGRGRGPVVQGKATPWTITFEMPSAPKGKATLRLGIATCNTTILDVAVNGQQVKRLDDLTVESSIGRNGIQGMWYEREVPFNASMMKSGTNTVTLTVPAGGPTNGLIYDYIRLELDEAAPMAVAQ